VAAVAVGGVLVEVLLGQVYRPERVVINVDAALGKVCRVEETLAADESAVRPVVAGAVGGFNHGDRMSGRRRCAYS